MESLNKHDSVILSAYNGLDKINHDVYANYDQKKNTSVSGVYPDIIITKKNDPNVKFIIKVEIEDNVTNNEVEQWKLHSKLGGTFYLLVPYELKQKAELLCLQNSIKARFGTYKYNGYNYIISYE